jgi:hypothetical protein
MTGLIQNLFFKCFGLRLLQLLVQKRKEMKRKEIVIVIVFSFSSHVL